MTCIRIHHHSVVFSSDYIVLLPILCTTLLGASGFFTWPASLQMVKALLLVVASFGMHYYCSLIIGTTTVSLCLAALMSFTLWCVQLRPALCPTHLHNGWSVSQLVGRTMNALPVCTSMKCSLCSQLSCWYRQTRIKQVYEVTIIFKELSTERFC